MNFENIQFVIVEETSAQQFLRQLEIAANNGYMVVSSNLIQSRYEGESIYFALMSRKSHKESIRKIPVIDL